MGINWHEEWFPWVLLGAVFIIINYFVVSPADANFYMGLVYAIASFDVALMVWLASKGSTNMLAMLVGSLVGSLPLITLVMDVALGFAVFAVYAGAVGVGAVYFLSRQKSFGSSDDKANYFAAFPMVMWLLWALMFFYGKITMASVDLTFQTLLYHGGVLVFALLSIYRFFGFSKAEDEDDKAAKISMLLIGVATLGMLLLTQGLGGTLSVWA